MELPDIILESIRSKRVVLFLGAGASIGAVRADGSPIPLGNNLRDLLSNQFLDGKYSDGDLAWVAQLAESATDLFTVQDFVAQQFQELKPANFHKLIPSFLWRGIATTNYDLILENVYKESKSRLQEIVPFLSNRDRIDEKLSSPDHVGYLKLHGCITRTHDQDIPLILTPDQYITHQKNRDRIFKMLIEWGTENIIIFVGHQLYDLDIRAVLLQLSQEISSRPRYYLIKPDVDQLEKDLWGEKRITVLPGTFEEFITALDIQLPATIRPILKTVQLEHPLVRKYRSRESLSPSILYLLNRDVEYLHSGLKYESGTQYQFYKGFDLGWYPVIETLDVRRGLTDTILNDVILCPEEERPTEAELYLIKAEAGAGKTILLRRIAWESATEADEICLYVKPDGEPSIERLEEIHRNTNKRIFLFIDDAADRISLIKSLILEARKSGLPITVITAARINEWNTRCKELTGYLTEEFQLRYLNLNEIEKLVKLLTIHEANGPNLKGLSFEEQVLQFEKRAGRQLLVALHEATMGIPFEEILQNEYDNITPPSAQSLYLTVCILNRLGISVRAGLIARVHDITFDNFKENLFKPLEHVVKVLTGINNNDFSYTARHPEIAQIVFNKVLTDPRDRYNEYIRIIKYLNISYSSDRSAFRGLIRGRSIFELFPRHEDAMAIYDIASEIAGEDAYLYQQRANYERLRPNGDYEYAEELLKKARILDPDDKSIIHTAAELSRAQAEKSEQLLEKVKFRKNARSLLSELTSGTDHDSFGFNTLVKLAIDDLNDLLKSDSTTEQDIGEAIRNVEKLLEQGNQKYPDDQYLFTFEADLGKLLDDNDRVRKALDKAFKTNPRDPYIAGRYSRVLEATGDTSTALDCIKTALESNRNDKNLNFRYASILRKYNPENHDLLSYHYRLAFTKWDDNYEAQFWFGRYCYESDDTDRQAESKEVFRRLRAAPIEHDKRIRVRDYIRESEVLKKFTGNLTKIESSHGFVIVDGRGDHIFLHRSNIEKDIWPILASRMRVQFSIGFTFGGPVATSLSPI